MSHPLDYDYLVIGGGSGGVGSAMRAAQLYGKRVAIVEGARWGGTCVNAGCVPKKILWSAASLRQALREEAPHYTFDTISENDYKIDWKRFKEQRDGYIARLNRIYHDGLVHAGVTVLEGWAALVDEHTARIKFRDGTIKMVTSLYILIATGSKPVLPKDTPGMQHVITSDEFFQLERQPKKAVVVGAGYIAVELSSTLAVLGTHVDLFIRKDSNLRSFEPEVIQFLEDAMTAEGHGLTLHRNTDGIAAVELDADGSKTVKLINGEVCRGADVVLMAVGRVPNTDGLGLENIPSIVRDDKGAIVVDEFQTTSVANIFAVGDVAGKVELTPMAIAAGRRLADRLFGPKETHRNFKVTYENVPTVIFSHPPIGTIGLTEPEAIEKFGIDGIKIYRSSFVNLHYSMFQGAPSDKPKTFMKLICAGSNERVIGLHMVGREVDEILQGFGVAIKMGATKADLDSCIAIHPTAAEELVTMGTWGTSSLASGRRRSKL